MKSVTLFGVALLLGVMLLSLDPADNAGARDEARPAETVTIPFDWADNGLVIGSWPSAQAAGK